MQIIHLVLGKGNPNRMNGVNKVAHTLATVQTQLGYKVSLWGIANSLTHNFPPRNYSTILFRQLANKLKIDADLARKLKTLSANTIVHIHGSFIPEFYHVSRILKKNNVPYVYTSHGALAPGAMEKNGMIKRVYFQLFEQSILRSARAVQVLGKSVNDNIARLVTLGNKVLIPNGQDLEELPFVKKEASNKLVFGFCGRIDIYHKGLDLMLKGFSQYRDMGGTGSLELIGDGADMKKLQSQTLKLGVEKFVRFHGAKFGYEKFQLIGNFDLFLHTSRMEGFPVAVLEAAGLGVPCLVSEATNVASYIEEHNAGFALTQNNPDEIAKIMMEAENCYKKSTLKEKGALAERMVEDVFDWKHIARQLIHIYQGNTKIEMIFQE